jgi:hypothetical protein
MFARALIAGLLTIALAGCAAGPSPFGSSTGTIAGHVQIRACGGAYRPEQPTCSPHPYAGVTLTFSLTAPGSTGSDHTVTTDANGSYRIDLKPGTYTVRAAGPGDQAGGLEGPREIVVSAGKTVTADFVYSIHLL